MKILELIGMELLASPRFILKRIQDEFKPMTHEELMADRRRVNATCRSQERKRVYVYSDKGFVFALVTEEQMQNGGACWVLSDEGWGLAWL